MKRWRLAPAAGAVLALAGCSTYETGPSGSEGDGKTAVFLTDAPFPFDRIRRVDIHIDEIALSLQADTSEGLPTWVTVARPERTFNLLDLQNGTTALLGEADVPPGQYHAVRVTFDPDRSGMTDRDGGHPAVDWQAKGDAPSLFSMVEEPMAGHRHRLRRGSKLPAGQLLRRLPVHPIPSGDHPGGLRQYRGPPGECGDRRSHPARRSEHPLRV